MRRRWGLRAQMTGSYVLVTAAASIVAVAVAAGVLWWRGSTPASAPGPAAGALSLVSATAYDYAGRVSARAARLGRLPTAGELRLGDATLRLAPGEARVSAGGEQVLIPYLTAAPERAGSMSLAVLITADRRIVSSSLPTRYRDGERFEPPGGPNGESPEGAAAGQRATPDGTVLWALAPVSDFANLTDTRGRPAVLGAVYVQAPASGALGPAGAAAGGDRDQRLSDSAELLGLLVVVLLGALPIGVVFGRMSTRPLVRRLRRLAGSTVAVAAGDLDHRIPVTRGDEIGQLEHHFNTMAERLDTAMRAERQLARTNERGRIARELHDAISQNLYSLHLLATGLRKALPAGSALHRPVETMEQTTTTTMREMHALLLELRPVALAGGGLARALEDLAGVYRDRLGVAVETEIEPVEMPPASEDHLFRIAQEALTNAIRHARPTRLTLRLGRRDGAVALEVTDDGVGFDAEQAGRRHGFGLGLIRERTAELGGTLQIETGTGAGTRLRIMVPGDQP